MSQICKIFPIPSCQYYFILYQLKVLCCWSWKDNEGQTALHYAAVCEREGIAEYLVKKNADTNVKDNDGNSPSDLCESNWPWLQRAKE